MSTGHAFPGSGPAIRIVTDAAADLPADIAERLGVSVVSGLVRFGPDPWSGSADDFWPALRATQEHPATMAPSAVDLAAAYAGDDSVLAVHVSAELSSTVEHARAAIPAARHVIDTRSLSIGTGIVAMAAAEAATAGVGWEQLLGLVDGWVDQVHLHGVIDDADLLVRGGRAGLVAGKVSRHARRHVLAVKGHVIPISQTRHRGQAVRELLAHVQEHVPNGSGRWAVGHGDAVDIEEIVDRSAELFGCAPAYVALLGAPVGAHVGPQSVLVAFLSPD